MTSRINDIKPIEKLERTSITKKKNSDVQVFTTKVPTSNKPDWDIAHYETMKKWAIKDYKWTAITDTNNAIIKSQKNLIDLLRYYEGDPKNNYKAKGKFKDLGGVGTTTYGYGITQLPKSISSEVKPPQNEREAYETLMLYLDKVSYPETKRLFGKDWNTFPESLKEALLDFNFNKGTTILKQRAKTIKEAYKNNDWNTLLNNLVYEYPGASSAEKTEKAGLFKRSLSRAILATRDFEQTEDVKETIANIYTRTRNCAIRQNSPLTEIDKIYSTYCDSLNELKYDKAVMTESSEAEPKKQINKKESLGFFKFAKILIELFLMQIWQTISE